MLRTDSKDYEIRCKTANDLLHTVEQQDSALRLFARSLKKQPKVLDAWDDSIWVVMVEKAIVHRDRSITFIFYNGKEITIEA